VTDLVQLLPLVFLGAVLGLDVVSFPKVVHPAPGPPVALAATGLMPLSRIRTLRTS
jgi:hypothetical protein